MVTYQFDVVNQNPVRIGQDGQAVATLRAKGFFVRDLQGEFGSQSFEMRLPAPWRGMRYRLVQDGRELASAPRAEYYRGGLAVKLEMPGRELELVSQDKRGLGFVLTEGGQEVARFQQRDVSQQQDWFADYHTREESIPLAAFVVWVILETRRHLNSR